MLKHTFLPLLILAIPAMAAAQTNFRGEWHFDLAKSENIGGMKTMQETQVIDQTKDRVVIHDHATFMGQTIDRDVTLDLDGSEVANDDPMGNHARTTSHWDGNTLVTTWKTEGAVAGTTVERIEKRLLREGTMVVESIRRGRPAVVMVYDRR